ncbi:glycosyltransferase family 2 protein [Sphaerospermopsis aphanizomenoides BCCUSP55]|nr:glycosyltransferase family 2 protein [Sphaerospermopsis aphanizomenoides BCCUSP55]
MNKKNFNFSIEIFISSHKNLSISRNIGIQKSSGKIIAFIDDDTIPATDRLDRLISTYSLYGDKCAGVGGTVRDMTILGYPLQYSLQKCFGLWWTKQLLINLLRRSMI